MNNQLTSEQEQILQQGWVKNIKCVPLYGGKKYPIWDSEKHTNTENKTGTALLHSTMGPLVIIDVDNEKKDSWDSLEENFKKLR